MAAITIIIDAIYTIWMVFFELLLAGIFICFCLVVPLLLSYALVNNGHHIMDPSVALVIGAGLITIISKEW
jgi:hypothetical protein